ncbi:uncharacterized protein DNG_03648 [Cephalotrichum gorgonifer]|uniref:Centromere protein H C-terminal domain-containing protein n=1 Tax=Cephalotrichum gorgonifer TaxID=2041049 RepID=A0AAE8SUG7_9PEZI|nr:uncharacterized protein DNG_03648 [Cephalotrichum gorgonifer]
MTSISEQDAGVGSTITPTLPLSKSEEEVLQHYDKLQELKLEIALLKAQQSYNADTPPGSISKSQEEALQARSLYSLNRDIVDNVLMVAPILKAIHHRIDSSPIETDIIPLIRERDSASIATAKQSSELRTTLDELTQVQSEALIISQSNVAVTSELLELAEEAKRRKLGRMTGPTMEDEMKTAEEEVKESRQKWKVMKGTASAVVVGSGVDWVRDPELRDVVLDPENEG